MPRKSPIFLQSSFDWRWFLVFSGNIHGTKVGRKRRSVHVTTCTLLGSDVAIEVDNITLAQRGDVDAFYRHALENIEVNILMMGILADRAFFLRIPYHQISI